MEFLVVLLLFIASVLLPCILLIDEFIKVTKHRNRWRRYNKYLSGEEGE